MKFHIHSQTAKPPASHETIIIPIPGRQTGANMGLAGRAACSFQKESYKVTMKCCISAGSSFTLVGVSGSSSLTSSFSRSWTSRAERWKHGALCYTLWKMITGGALLFLMKDDNRGHFVIPYLVIHKLFHDRNPSLHFVIFNSSIFQWRWRRTTNTTFPVSTYEVPVAPQLVPNLSQQSVPGCRAVPRPQSEPSRWVSGRPRHRYQSLPWWPPDSGQHGSTVPGPKNITNIIRSQAHYCYRREKTTQDYINDFT